MDCIFCKIVKGEIPSYKVYENEKVLAFLDINPANYGHVLVIPKEHYNNILDIEEEDLIEITKAVKKIAEILAILLEPDGINILQSNNPAAGQVINHIHFHIIPRFVNDNVTFHWEPNKLEKKQFEELAKRLKEELDN
ncbi:MAG: HIT family protein [Candidatus Woesearchaeota archaeon]